MRKHKYLPVLWFIIGFTLFMSTRTSKIIPFIYIAIVIAPIFILGFTRSQTVKKGNLLTILGFTLSLNIAMWGLFNTGDPLFTLIYNLVRNSILALLISFPYIMDRVVIEKFKKRGTLSTLIFPVMATATFFLISLEGPFDGDMISATFEYGNLSFKQIASITGLSGFVFIFSWLASVINHIWDNEFNWGKIKKVTLIFASVLLIITIFGVIKTSSLMSPESVTVKIASIILLPEKGKPFDPEALFSKEASPFDETMLKIKTLTEKAVSNNAKIVTFQEASIKISENNEKNFINLLGKIAKDNDIYYSMSYGVYPEEGKGYNKHVLFNNQGELEIDYAKRYLVGLGDLFGETRIYYKGPEVIQAVDTPYGIIGVSICKDMAFASYIRQAGKMKIDIMLSPSYDVPKSRGPWYSLRAIENGFSIVRPVYNGYSYAMDYNGKLLAHMDSDETEDGIMYADVPTKGVNTIYSTIGDLLGWLSVLGLFVFTGVGIRIKKSQEHQNSYELAYKGGI